MKRLTKEDIEKINKELGDDWDQGIWEESSYVPTEIKGPCCILRWHREGRGGSCWDDEDTVNETYYFDKPPFTALDLTLNAIGVGPMQSEYIKNNFVNNIDDAGSYYGYYGDYDDYEADWVELEQVYKYLGI